MVGRSILVLGILLWANWVSAQLSPAWTTPLKPRSEYKFGYKAIGFVPWGEGRRMMVWRSGAVVQEGPESVWVNGVANKVMETWPDSLPQPETYIIRDAKVTAGHSPKGLVWLNAGLLAQAKTEIEVAYIWAVQAAKVLLGQAETIPIPIPLPELAEDGSIRHTFKDEEVPLESNARQADSLACAWLLNLWPDSAVQMAKWRLGNPTDTVAVDFGTLIGIKLQMASQGGIAEQTIGFGELWRVGEALGQGKFMNMKPPGNAVPPEIRAGFRRLQIESLLLQGAVSKALYLSSAYYFEAPNPQMKGLLGRSLAAYASFRCHDSSPDKAKGVSSSFLEWANQFQSTDWTCIGIKVVWPMLASHPDDTYWEQVLTFLMERMRQAGFRYEHFFGGNLELEKGRESVALLSDFGSDPLFREMVMAFLETDADGHFDQPDLESKVWKNDENPRFRGDDALNPGKVLILQPFWMRVIGDKSGYSGWIPDEEMRAKRKAGLKKAVKAAGMDGVFAETKDLPLQYRVDGFHQWNMAIGGGVPYPFIGEISKEMEARGVSYLLDCGSYSVATKPRGNGTWFAGSLLFGISLPGLMPFVVAETASYIQKTYFFEELRSAGHLDIVFKGTMYVEEKDRNELVRARMYDLFKQIDRRMEEGR